MLKYPVYKISCFTAHRTLHPVHYVLIILIYREIQVHTRTGFFSPRLWHKRCIQSEPLCYGTYGKPEGHYRIGSRQCIRFLKIYLMLRSRRFMV